MKPPRISAPPGFVPYSKFHAVVSKWKARHAALQDELRRRDAADEAARRPIVGAIAQRVVVLSLPKRAAAAERQNGLTTSGDRSGGIKSEDPN
jgi:hypothetical protein